MAQKRSQEAHGNSGRAAQLHSSVATICCYRKYSSQFAPSHVEDAANRKHAEEVTVFRNDQHLTF